MESRSGCSGRLAGFAAGLLVLLVVITLPFGLLGRSLEDGLFSANLPQMLEERLISSGFLRELVLQALFQDGMDSGLVLEGVELTAAFEYLSPEDQQEIAERLLPEEWFSEQIHALIENTFTWFDSDSIHPDWRIDFSPLRNNMLRGGGAASIAEIMISSWPECTPEDARGMAAFLGGGEQPPFLCEPPDPMRTQLLEEATLLFRQLAENIPAETRFGEQLLVGTDPARIQALKDVVRGVRRLANALIFLPLLFLGLMMALVIRSWPGLLRWWGSALGLGGGISILVALRLSRLVDAQIVAMLESMGREAPELRNVLGEIADGLASLVLEGFALRSLTWAILGGGAFVVGWLLQRGFRLGRKQEVTPSSGSLEAAERSEQLTPPSVEPLVPDDDEEPPDPPSGIYG